MLNTVFDLSTRIIYNTEDVNQSKLSDLSTKSVLYEEGYNVWLRSYTIEDEEGIKKLILNNNLDDFLNRLIFNDGETNKVIDLDGVVFIHLHILADKDEVKEPVPLIFIASPTFVWSIQNTSHKFFESIETRIIKNIGLASRKKADYLLGLLIETIIDSYENVIDKHTYKAIYHADITNIRPTPEFLQEVEKVKQELFVLKKSALSLRDSITKIENTESMELEEKYFRELREQVKNVLNDIDFHMQTLESKISLLFSIQGHRLNEIMKTLTIFSVIFIPLTFIVGVYGMNFVNMPELEWENGYYYSLLLMAAIVIILIVYVRRRFK